jgi:hypothetical protein
MWRHILNFNYEVAANFLERGFIPHNASMRFCEALRRALHALLLVSLCISLLLSPSAAKTRPAHDVDSGYIPALAVADHFLQAWQAGDTENGIALLTSRAKETATTDGIDKFFSNSAPSAYEIGRGKMLKHGRYEFPVVLVGASRNNLPRRRFSSIVIVDTGHNDWAVDTLP